MTKGKEPTTDLTAAEALAAWDKARNDYASAMMKVRPLRDAANKARNIYIWLDAEAQRDPR